MRYPRAQVVGLIEHRSGASRAAEAERELPEEVDDERDAELLERYGVGRGELAAGGPQGGGDLAGGELDEGRFVDGPADEG